MTAVISLAQAHRFRALLTRRLGLRFDDAKLGWLADVLHRHAGPEPDADERFLLRLEGSASRAELAALAQDLTVGETYFFRGVEQLDALRDDVLPERAAARPAERRLRILSAGCASGEEPYTLAMALHGRLPGPDWTLEIDAVDMNPQAIATARSGRYSPWSLRATPPALRERWFRSEGRELAIDASLQSAVRFAEANLGDAGAACWRPAHYDMVFCRNVLMYFEQQGAQALVERIADALAPGGHLFLGHAETLHGLSTRFEWRHTREAFYYRLKPAGDAPAAGSPPGAKASSARPSMPGGTPPPPSSAVPLALPNDPPLLPSGAEPLAGGAPLPRQGDAPLPLSRAEPLARALGLFRSERFADALALVESLGPQEAGADANLLLLHAVLLAHRSESAAQTACARVPATAPDAAAGAHYVLALCREGSGDPVGAQHHDRRALHLDPSFAMPHLHLGRLARRTGDLPAAREALHKALVLLEHETALRLLLFGGGFGREALVAMCRAELRACGGRP